MKNRPPIVAVVGHIDHGKSTLLDYIRKTNVVEGEAGGITQHLSAYQAVHKNESGEHTITFLDTPGHAAFRAMRSRGLEAADIAILVVSAEEGVKPQTMEALELIKRVGLPYVVAFSKIDKPNANLERAKMSMLEHQVFLEGLGGEVPWVGISSKNGEGVPELLDLILLAAELKGLPADPTKPAQGLVIEAHVDNRRGSTATLIIRDGSIKSGQFVVAESAWAPTRIMENFLGKAIKEAGPSTPVRIVGFSELPRVGAEWSTVESKKEAEAQSISFQRSRTPLNDERLRPSGPERRREGDAAELGVEEEVETVVLPLVIKTDVAGTGEAVMHELQKLPKHERMEVRVVSRAVGPISEADVKQVAGSQTPGIIVGFNVKVEPQARDLAERQGVTIVAFDIIYQLAEWLETELENRRPRTEVEEVTGSAKVLKFFSAAKGRVVVGGRVEEGELGDGAEVRVMRRDLVLGHGKIVSLQSQKREVKKVEKGEEFGTQIKIDVEPAAGDRLEAYKIVLK